jgi:hypothetical protein
VPAGLLHAAAAPAATLLLSGGIDPATPPRHGARVAQALGPKARHVVVPNAGHGLLALAACATRCSASSMRPTMRRRCRSTPLRARRAAPAGLRAAGQREGRP